MLKIGMAVVIVLAIGCGDDGGSAGVDAPTGVDGPTCSAPKIVYVHHDGGTYTKVPLGMGSSSANTTWLLGVPTATFSAITETAGTFAMIDACVKQKLADFNIEVVSTDPGTVPHRELLWVPVQEFVDNINGVSTNIAETQCPSATDMLASSIMFAQSPLQGTNAVSDGCANAAQLIGFTFGLEATTDCRDLASQTMGCDNATRSFLDESLPCGFGSTARDCMCGGSTQNSYRVLLATAGAACAL